uniref:Uncharacterized protein n=1 Tax=Candidatus Kentrum sp. DK TaxID=2126562 RepID=A0A450TFC4_9GAMM|nr:MAG: hypothetical protein BECKDK2373C_GA0170839_11365 [Candidatus Kentron sp. DK]
MIPFAITYCPICDYHSVALSSGALCIRMDGNWNKITGKGYCPPVFYSNDFSAGAGAEWTNPTISTANGESFLAAASYGSGNGTNSLRLSGLPEHTKVTVAFDLYIIQSWDGNGGGADNWQLTVGETGAEQPFFLLFTNFTNNTATTQAYPNQLPPYGDGGSFAPRTGAFENGHLDFGTGSWGDATYRFSFTFDHSASDIFLNFTGLQNQAASDEGWGLDNVKVSVN